MRSFVLIFMGDSGAYLEMSLHVLLSGGAYALVATYPLTGAVAATVHKLVQLEPEY